jgi:small subunit ribosomal protein S21e
MENEAGEKFDLYCPRKWFVYLFIFNYIFYIFSSSSARLIGARDHASVQIDFVDVDPQTGVMLSTGSKRYTICGDLRRMV